MQHLTRAWPRRRSDRLHELERRCGHRAEAESAAAPTSANTVADTGWVRAETFTALPYAGFEHTSYTVKPAPLTITSLAAAG